MELVGYDKRTKTSTIKLTDVELVDLNELVLGVLNTYDDQDPTVLGVSEKRLAEIKVELSRILEARLAPVPAAR
jgi:hypothetical protein